MIEVALVFVSLEETMRKMGQLLTENKLVFDIFNIILGIGLIVMIVLFILHPNNMLIFTFLCWIAGIMNVTNGFKNIKKNRFISLCMITVGMIIILGGFYILL